MSLLCPHRPQPMHFFADHLRASEHAKQTNGGIVFPVGTVSPDIVKGLIALVHHAHIDIADCRNGEVLGHIDAPSASWLIASFSNDGRRMVAYNFDKLCIWQSDDRWATHTLLRSMELPQHYAPTLTDQGQTLIVDAEQHDCLIEIDVASGEEKTRYPGPNDSAYCVSHDARLLAETTHQGIRVRNRETGKLVFDQLVDSQPRDLKFVADDRVLLSLNNDGSLTAWHIPTRQALGTLFAPEHLHGVPIHLQIAANGRRVIMNYHHPENRIPVVLGRP